MTFSLPEIAKSHLYQQAGNSVTVPLIERIFGEMKKVL
ncbi:MAG: DNA cytosine methyltransferase [Neisseriaceae bacterium]|nr:DNA cytosine methyltransferase [Neisseriaceae bacterium]